MIKSVSSFLQKSRARNDASNRAEFVNSLEEQRQKLGDSAVEATCARADAKTMDRDTQMKYDVAKNEDGPLKRTMKRKRDVDEIGSEGKRQVEDREDGGVLTEIHSGIEQRFSDIEKHLAVRYGLSHTNSNVVLSNSGEYPVPGIPHDFSDRLKRLEDHIISIEKEYPPWAALHFDQPGRNVSKPSLSTYVVIDCSQWPPAPKATPIIVPRHLIKSSVTENKDTNAPSVGHVSASVPVKKAIGGQKLRNTTSSLSKAVLERYQVQQALAEK
jgi:hypothetical protein